MLHPVARSFDAGRSPPHLEGVLESLGGREALREKRALVPGCGRGYDVETLAKYVAFATGLELAPTAVKSAQEYLESRTVTNASVINDDFLSPKTDDTYDVGYGALSCAGRLLADCWPIAGRLLADCWPTHSSPLADYTFFCALHPSMRNDWAKGWAHFINPGGILIATVFPVFTDDSGNPFNSKDTGPPWPVTPEDYQVLEKEGFELVSMERVSEGQSHPPRSGLEWVGVWRRLD